MSDILDAYTPRETDPNADQVLDPNPKAGRRTQLAVTWETKAIALDLGPYLKSLTHSDPLSGESDGLTFELQDRAGLWSTDWRPTFGDTATARLRAERWFGLSDFERRNPPSGDLLMGTFAHDGVSLGGPPMQAQFKCVSAAVGSGLRRRKRTHAWRGVTLKRIAQDIADRAGLTLQWDGAEGSRYKQALQNNKSDLEFLTEECKEVGRTLKVTEGKIAIFRERDLDARAKSGDISLVSERVISYKFDADDSARYGSCHVVCFNPVTGKTVKYQFPRTGQTIEGLDENGQTLELRIEVSDAAEAQERAEALLRNENRFAVRGHLETVGDPHLVAGVTFDLTHAFGFNGRFIITKAEHRYSTDGGYRCGLDVRRTLEGY